MYSIVSEWYVRPYIKRTFKMVYFGHYPVQKRIFAGFERNTIYRMALATNINAQY